MKLFSFVPRWLSIFVDPSLWTMTMTVVVVAHGIFKMHCPLPHHLWVGQMMEIPLGMHPGTICIEKFHTKTVSILSFLMFEKCQFHENFPYSQLCLHVTGQQAGISYQTTEHAARRPVYTQRVSLVFAHTLAKVRNFKREHSVNTWQHLAIYTSIASKNADMQRVKTLVKKPLLYQKICFK